MGKSKFIFKKLTKDDIGKYIENARIFNMTKEDMLHEQIVLQSFDDDVLGSSREKMDIIALQKNSREWEILDLDIDEFNLIPICSVLDIDKYEKLVIVIRKMSDMLMDKIQGRYDSYMYNIVDDKFNKLHEYPVLCGKLARYKIDLNKPMNEVKDDINRIKDEYDRNKLLEGLDMILKK